MTTNPEKSVTIQRMNYKGWPDAYRLSNGAAEVVVVPAIARVMRFAFVGGPNLIWENPAALGTPAKAGEWPNYGGEKAWPWPQDDWGKRLPSAWPPPTGADDVPHAATVVGNDTVRLVSPVVAGYGVRIVREVTLVSYAARVTIRTRLEKVEGEPVPIAPWVILQTPVPTSPLVARLTGKSPLPEGWKTLAEGAWKRVERQGNLLYIERVPAPSAKLGFDGDALAAVFGDALLKVVATPETTHGFLPGERGQVYSNADSDEDKKRGVEPYVEWEFTAPLRPLKTGEASTLVTEWDLTRLPEGGALNAAEAATALADPAAQP